MYRAAKKKLELNVVVFIIYPINAEKVHLYFYLILSVTKQMLQGANTDLLTHLSLKLTIMSVKNQNILFPLQIKPVKVSLKL